MDVSTVLTLVQTILQVLDSTPISIQREIESVWGYKSQHKKLKATMITIRAVLLDAEQQERQQLQLSYIIQDKLERLKEAVYRADDLFDEVATLARRKNLIPGNSLRKEVYLFFSRFNQLCSAFNMSREIREIKEILDHIAGDHHDFGARQQVGVEVSLVRNNPRETHSYLCEEDVIIGRDDDKRVMMDMLLDVNVEENVCFISIVGIGGLGKTTLAQLVYNDDRIRREFPLRMWVCVSDDLSVKALLGEILAVATNKAYTSGLNLDQLQSSLREQLDGKKYLLVLDDIWNEDCEEWLKLRNLLNRGGKGSRVIVTTRSGKVANIVGSQMVHELKGLSEKDSWKLFERMTLESREHQLEAKFVDIGREIVRKCANVPLALRIIGSVLRGQGEGQWRYMKNTDLANVKQDEINGIVPVLKISYYYLPVHLKSCFTHCAIFPKDYKIIKEDLICLWMAQGFIVPLDGESFEDAGEAFFLNLLQRCFFQDVERDGSGDIISCKMHDLIHDVAKEVAGTEIFSASSFNEKTRHLFLDSSLEAKYVNSCLTKMKRLRTILQPFTPYAVIHLNNLLLKAKFLRVLDMRYNDSKKLPSMIGELLHLKYLDLSYSKKLCVLPMSITKLYNLQTLKLCDCASLRELPRELSKLVNLRHLDTRCCRSLTHMPQGMNYMTSLHKLTRFVLGDNAFGDLKYLNNLRDNMEIKVQTGWTYNAVEVRNGGYLINKPYLCNISIYWYLEPYEKKYRRDEDSETDNSEALLQGLQPHSNLQMLELWYYPGVRFPNWGGSSMNLESCLPNLVKIELDGCTRLEHLPLMSQLRHLKVLVLKNLFEVEYVESSNIREEWGSTTSRRSRQVGADYEMVFFPSLEKLELQSLRKLKGWWKSSSHSCSESGEVKPETCNGVHDSNNNGQRQQDKFSMAGIHLYSYSFPKLYNLEMFRCPELTTFPLCPKLEILKLHKFNEALGPIMSASSVNLSFSTNGLYQDEADRRGRLREVKINNVGYLNSMPIGSFHHLSQLEIMYDWNLERLTTGEIFRSGCLSSLRTLVFDGCKKRKQLSEQGVWEHLTALETLHLRGLTNLELDDKDEDINRGEKKEDIHGADTNMPWRCLAPTLHNLELRHLPKLVKLPKGIYHLTALHSLTIHNCRNLEALSPWIACLSSLHSLSIWSCERLKSLPEEMRYITSLQRLSLYNNSEELKARCLKPIGADWPKIQHIPDISF